MALHTPPTALSLVFVLPPLALAEYAERPHGATPMRGKIAAVCEKIPFTGFSAYDSTPLSLDADIHIKSGG